MSRPLRAAGQTISISWPSSTPKRQRRCDCRTAYQLFGIFTGPKSMRRAVATLPVAETDVALTGRRVPWFQEWIRHGPDNPYWQAALWSSPRRSLRRLG